MRTSRRIASSLIAAFVAAVAFAGDDNTLPANPAEALTRATPAIEAARKAKSAETPDIPKGIRRAVDWMQPFAKKAADDEAWSGAWNEALTLSRFHGNKPTADYTLKTTLVATGMQVGLPAGRHWNANAGAPRPGHLRQYGGIQRVRSDGSVAVSISVCVYSFNTLYTGSGRQGGVGGENATGLAKEFLDYDKALLAKVDSASTTIAARPLSKGFGRAQFYEIVGTSKDLGRVRLRSYFAKTSERTYAFDVTQLLDAHAGDTPAETWQNGVDDPELDAVLGSLEESKK